MKNKLLIIFAIIFFMNCTTKEKVDDVPIKIMVKIGDAIITQDEFIRRAEYTIRPNYCKSDFNVHKKIILNSLIAEKLLALEIANDSIVEKDDLLNSYIKGRKDQAMRELHYYNEGTKKVKIDKKEINDIYHNAGKKYNLIFLNMPNKKLAGEFLSFIKKENISFEDGIREYLQSDELPIQEISYDNTQNSEIHNILFHTEIDKNKIYGPVEMLSSNAVLFKVLTWTDSKVITDSQIQLRYNDVREKVTRIKADAIYGEYVHKIMSGKKMDFNRDTFVRLSALYSEMYNIRKKNNKEVFNKEVWGKETELNGIDSLNIKFKNLKDAVLLTLDGENWTVEKFQQELKTHPLVFRKDDISAYEFSVQFRLAIADMIRDKYITLDAYEKGYDKLQSVKNQTAMWKDNVIANYYRDKYLYDKGFVEDFDTKYMTAIHDYLNPVVDSLQAKYSNLIYVNTKMFNAIELTNIDLFAIQKNVPYPVVVPAFPIFTDDDKLDYGKKLEE